MLGVFEDPNGRGPLVGAGVAEYAASAAGERPVLGEGEGLEGYRRLTRAGGDQE
ncbi:hypothetical protein TCELL_1037 [Thermogladius calderae 1633]|uniref:Uncharacterized protein n=1 Tax=Thermogladius calderae (strain DSM 22663 / VKM B-2946 / 1633) TaxID=1184251 RepID=I3TFC2_THEC1|nr:hypothetical protein TCELL_1037 [Thermogladius calderae 1633]